MLVQNIFLVHAQKCYHRYIPQGLDTRLLFASSHFFLTKSLRRIIPMLIFRITSLAVYRWNHIVIYALITDRNELLSCYQNHHFSCCNLEYSFACRCNYSVAYHRNHSFILFARISQLE